MHIIEAAHLTKKYGPTIAVEDVSLSIPKGKIYGFLGLNGAGKTTTMRMLLGMIKANLGSIRLFGKPVGTNLSIWSRVGYMIETAQAYPNLSVWENLQLYQHYYRLDGEENIHEVISLLKLEKYRTVKSKHLSLGNLQRLALSQALINHPELLILDEPVNGLDPSGIVEIRELLKQLADQGTTIIISSHLLSEISRIADTIGIIHEGRLIKEIEATTLQQEIEQKLIIETLDNAAASAMLSERAISNHENSTNELEVDDPRYINHPNELAEQIIAQGIGLKKLYLHKEDLESYFLKTIQTATA